MQPVFRSSSRFIHRLRGRPQTCGCVRRRLNSVTRRAGVCLPTLFRSHLDWQRDLLLPTLPQLRPFCVSAAVPEPEPATMKLDSTLFRQLFTPELEYLAGLFSKYNFELRIAGGAVRDLLMGIVPADVDFATTATPDQMLDMFDKEQVRVLNKGGIKHGTVACRINDKENFEVTTLRVDVVCDGRHADVQFTTNWYKDANRRDLTINSMFCDLDGTVYDYFDGIQHVNERRVLFVGDATARIQEDYLRILRYFRFFGRITDDPTKHDADTLKAIRDNIQGLESISGERIWTELKKIVVGRYADAVVQCMLECNLATPLALPEQADTKLFSRIYQTAHSGGLSLCPMTVLSSLLRSADDVQAFHARVKLSNVERDLALYIVGHRGQCTQTEHNAALKHYQFLILDQVHNRVAHGTEQVQQLALYDLATDDTARLLHALQAYSPPAFPVNGLSVAKTEKVPKGRCVKVALDHLHEHWKSTDCTASEQQLLQLLSTDQTLAERLRAVADEEQQKRKPNKRKRLDSNPL